MHMIAYVSTAHILLKDDDLDSLLSKSRHNNLEHDITGLLLYKDGTFIQVIEGAESNIRRLYNNIQRDRLHHSVTTLLDEPIMERIFPNWQMGYARLRSFPDVQGFTRVLEDAVALAEFSEDTTDAKRLLASFAKR